jgi:hypothetical protein
MLRVNLRQLPIGSRLKTWLRLCHGARLRLLHYRRQLLLCASLINHKHFGAAGNAETARNRRQKQAAVLALR